MDTVNGFTGGRRVATAEWIKAAPNRSGIYPVASVLMRIGTYRLERAVGWDPKKEGIG